MNMPRKRKEKRKIPPEESSDIVTPEPTEEIGQLIQKNTKLETLINCLLCMQTIITDAYATCQDKVRLI